MMTGESRARSARYSKQQGPHVAEPERAQPSVHVLASYATDADARRYELGAGIIGVALVAAYLAAAVNIIPLWALVMLVALVLPRWLVYFHELFHVRTASKVSRLNGLMLLPFTPFSLGYREFREIHWGHHKAPATEQDPDAFHILGGPIKAFLGAMTLSEQSPIRWLRLHRMDRQLAIGMGIRFALFATLLWISPWTFLVFWLSLRVTYALNDFVFFHYLHVREGRLGTFPVLLPEWFLRLFTLISGDTVVAATLYHDRHHAYPRVAARHLHALGRPQTENRAESI